MSLNVNMLNLTLKRRAKNYHQPFSKNQESHDMYAACDKGLCSANLP